MKQFFALVLAGGLGAGAALVFVKLPPSPDKARFVKAAHNSNAEEIPGENSREGRFRLLSAQSWFANGPTGTTVPVVMKIDTATGQSWTLIMTSVHSNASVFFVEAPNVPTP